MIQLSIYRSGKYMLGPTKSIIYIMNLWSIISSILIICIISFKYIDTSLMTTTKTLQILYWSTVFYPEIIIYYYLLLFLFFHFQFLFVFLRSINYPFDCSSILSIVATMMTLVMLEGKWKKRVRNVKETERTKWCILYIWETVIKDKEKKRSKEE